MTSNQVVADQENPQPELREIVVQNIHFLISPILVDEIERLRGEVGELQFHVNGLKVENAAFAAREARLPVETPARRSVFDMAHEVIKELHRQDMKGMRAECDGAILRIAPLIEEWPSKPSPEEPFGATNPLILYHYGAGCCSGRGRRQGKDVPPLTCEHGGKLHWDI